MQGIDDTSRSLMQAFSLPANGSTEVLTSATGTVVSTTVPVVTTGFYEFTATADCYVAVGAATATIPAVGVPGAVPIPASTPKVVYELKAGSLVSAIGAAAFSLFITKV